MTLNVYKITKLKGIDKKVTKNKDSSYKKL